MSNLQSYLGGSCGLNEDRVAECIAMAKTGEDLFKRLTRAYKTELELDKQHIDFIWEGKKVDVKGLKKAHRKGFVVVELVNRWGGHGWAHKDSKAEYIAFQFEDCFDVVPKDALRELTIDLCVPFKHDLVIRKNYTTPTQGAYNYCGRWSAQDIFTYIKREDLKDIVEDRIPIPKMTTQMIIKAIEEKESQKRQNKSKG